MDGGGTLDDLVLGYFAGEYFEDWPLPFSFKDRAVMDFNLVPLDCD